MQQIGNYPIVRKLGEGATSEVFLCHDPFRNREVAVKRIFPEALHDPVRGRLFRKLFFTEASLAGKLVHPHICQIFDAGMGDDAGYIVMEYVPGGTVELFCAPENLLPVEQVVDIVFKCTRALAYAHMHGVAHRDIKPGNILYATTPTDVRISDFGLALNVGAQTTQITGVGSPAYMSPEQIREDDAVDHRTDLYSLGVVMYQLLVGKLPFQATNKFSMIYQITNVDPTPPSKARHAVPAPLDRIVRRAMQKEAAKRYHSADEFADELLDALRAGRGERKEAFGDADKFAALRALRFFASFSDAELWEVVALAQWEKAPGGTVFIREGDRGDFFCVVLEGEARVTKNKKLLSVLGPGECFGEMAYLSLGSPVRGATVSAAADSRVLRILVAALEQASVSCRSKFDRAFIGILVERLNLANTRLTSG